jgi:predicted RNA-binding protein with PUA-like domain
MKKSQRFWMVKQEPAAYSWNDLLRDGKTEWTGVRNFQARNNLRAMKLGDPVLFYHSVSEKAVVGVAKVTREARPDPTAEEGGWESVEIAPQRSLKRPVTLPEIKANSHLQKISLVRQSRLSVLPLTKEEFEEIVRLAES